MWDIHTREINKIIYLWYNYINIHEKYNEIIYD
jgi:hypothetical protein